MQTCAALAVDLELNPSCKVLTEVEYDRLSFPEFHRSVSVHLVHDIYHAVIARTFCRTLVYRGSLYGQYIVVKHLYERSFLRFYHAVEASILSHGIPCTDVASVPVGHDACVIHLSVVYITTLHGTFS